MACCYDCRRVLKHVQKAHDILCVVHEGMIYMKQLVL